MASNANQPARTFAQGYLFGAPIGDLGWFATILLSVGTGFATFFLATFLGIVALMIRNASGHPTDYAISYKFIGLPIGLLALALTFAYLGTLWLRRITRK